MTTRIMAGLLAVVLMLLQYRIWASPDGMREVWRLEQAIEVQAAENTRLQTRNRTLAAEVRDLKEGRKAIEERARTDLGMVKTNETFFQVVPPAQPGTSTAPAADAASGQRQAQADLP